MTFCRVSIEYSKNHEYKFRLIPCIGKGDGVLDKVTFGQKLDYLKTLFRVTDKQIGAYVGAVPSLVCRWRNGERLLDRYKDEETVKRIAEFFTKTVYAQNQQAQLTEILLLSADEIDHASDSCIKGIITFLYDSQPIRKSDESDKGSPLPSLAENISGSFIGAGGLIGALTLLEERLKDRTDAEVSVYLSLEYSRLIQDKYAAEVWDILCRMNRDIPVRVVFDGWLGKGDVEKATQNLKALLPFMQAGKIQPFMIRSTQKFFYYNLTCFAKGAGMVVTTEPAGGVGDPISLFTESADYINGMGTVFAGLDRISKSLARHIGGVSTKDETVFYGRLFEPDEDLQVLSGGVNLLYLDDESYLALLKLNGIKGSQRSYRFTRFIEDKRRFNAFLEKNNVKEIFNLQALDRMVAEKKIITPDFSFGSGGIKASGEILKNLLNGMLYYIEKYKNLSVYFERENNTGFSCRIKGDSFVLLHTYEQNKNHVVYSDNWMLVYEYIKQFQEALQSDSLMNIKSAVTAALNMRLERMK